MAATVEIDIRTRVWKPEERIFVLFPGKQHAFYDTFLNRSVAFLDVPGLVLEDGLHPNEHKDYAARLKVSDAIRVWHDNGRPVGKPPARSPAQYPGARIGRRRALLAGQVGTLYADIRPGDLLVVPGKNYFSDTLIGEVRDAPRKYTQMQSDDYPGENIPVRRVNWVARVPKWRFSPGLIQRQQIPNPLTLLERSYWDEVLRVAYENYVYGERYNARLQTSKKDFTSFDSVNIESIFNVAAAIEAAFDMLVDTDDLDAVLELLANNIGYAPELVININSPGDISAYSKRLAPLVAAALIQLALSPESAAAADKLHVINSSAPNDHCAAVIDTRVKDTINMYGYARWQAQCARLKGTAERTGLKTQVRVRPIPPAQNP